MILTYPNPPQIPTSGRQLRSLNWCKLPEARITGTVFSGLDECNLYKFMDLEDIDRTFDTSLGKVRGMAYPLKPLM